VYVRSITIEEDSEFQSLGMLEERKIERRSGLYDSIEGDRKKCKLGLCQRNRKAKQSVRIQVLENDFDLEALTFLKTI